ncbi:MAG: hypothetical protein AAF514_08300, partial [Verrucomicrobiota bacterium]
EGRVYTGTDGWLYFRPGVDYLTGPGFLEERHRARRLSEEPSSSADPRPAILRFARELESRGIQLVLMPVPTKAMIHPEGLGFSEDESTMPQNPSYEGWVRELDAEGIPVFEASAVLWAMPEFAGPRFLKGDSHWTPVAMQSVAQELAAFLRDRFPDRLAEPGPLLDREEVAVRNRGDLHRMLDLPIEGDEGLEAVNLMSVGSGGEPWSADSSSGVLLLGDSFANIYSLGGMGWGAAGGLAEQLSVSLGFSVDRISINAGGAYGARQQLVQSLARGENRLVGKKIVVWEFAVRELTSGDWRVLPLPQVREPRPGQETNAERPAGWLEVEGTLAQNSGMPDPGEVLYKDGVTQFHLTGVQWTEPPAPGEEIVVLVWGMRDRVLTGAGEIEPGQRLKLRLLPWGEAEKHYGGYERTELEDPDLRLLDLPLFWGERLDD